MRWPSSEKLQLSQAAQTSVFLICSLAAARAKSAFSFRRRGMANDLFFSSSKKNGGVRAYLRISTSLRREKMSRSESERTRLSAASVQVEKRKVNSACAFLR